MKTFLKPAVGRCIISPDGMAIPTDPGNRDYEDFLRLQAAGRATLQDDAAPPEPEPALTVAELQRVLERAGSAALKSELANTRAAKLAGRP